MAVIEGLLADLRALGVCEGDLLLVHSSLNALKNNMADVSEITPHNVIDTLIAAVGEEGTLLLPALSYLFVTEVQTTFDIKNTPCCVGIIPETFRSAYPTVRSMHPTHSVCGLGKLTGALLEEHHKDRSPVGKYSPYRKLPSYGGKILMLGCGLRPMTFMHGMEEIVGTDYVLGKDQRDYTLIDQNGDAVTLAYWHHDLVGYDQRYDRLADVMEKGLAKGQTLGGVSYLLDSAQIEKIALDVLQKDQHYFVDKV